MWTALSLLFVAACAATLWIGRECLRVASGYKARLLCSAIFLSRRPSQSVDHTDLGVDDLAALKYFSARVDRTAQTVTVSFGGLATRRAMYREGTGSTLLYDGISDRGRLPPSALTNPLRPSRHEDCWPAGDHGDTAPLPPEIDAIRLHDAMDWAFTEACPLPQRRTRAVVIVYDGRIIAERYASGFGPETPLLGWSMTKSVINALAGILVENGRWHLAEPVPIREWRRPGDARGRIALEHLLRMTSGLAFTEHYRHPFKDTITMLLRVPDAAAYAINQPLRSEPGASWHYSSGNTTLSPVSCGIPLRMLRRACFSPDGHCSIGLA